jgi:hypothetical protein
VKWVLVILAVAVGLGVFEYQRDKTARFPSARWHQFVADDKTMSTAAKFVLSHPRLCVRARVPNCPTPGDYRFIRSDGRLYELVLIRVQGDCRRAVLRYTSAYRFVVPAWDGVKGHGEAALIDHQQIAESFRRMESAYPAWRAAVPDMRENCQPS